MLKEGSVIEEVSPAYIGTIRFCVSLLDIIFILHIEASTYYGFDIMWLLHITASIYCNVASTYYGFYIMWLLHITASI